MVGSKAAVFGGLICGAVAAAWLFGHGPDDASRASSESRGASRSVAKHGGGWNWILSDLKSLLETGANL